MRCFRAWIPAMMVVLYATAASAAVHHQHKQTEGEIRRHAFRKSTVGPGAFARTTGGAAFNHLHNHPRQWGQGKAGFAHRLASGLGRHVVKNTIQYGVGTLRHEDPRSTEPVRPRGFWPKIKDAAKNTFTVGRFGHRKRSVAAGRLSGAMGAGMISQAWMPAATAGAGVASGIWNASGRNLRDCWS
jgi:hypothetical protein